MLSRRRRRLAAALAIAVLSLLCLFAFMRLQHSGPVPVGAPTPVPDGPDWIDPFAPQHADAWRNITDEKVIFEIHDGVLHIFGRSVYPLRYAAFTGRTFGNLELHVEFKLAPGANSGLFLRAQSDDPVQRGFEVQIIDDYGKRPDKHGTGAIYDVVTPMFNLARPAGEWNSYDVRVTGTEVEVVVNGWPVVKTDFALMVEPLGKFAMPYAGLPREGMIMFQDHGGEIWFRNLRIRNRPRP